MSTDTANPRPKVSRFSFPAQNWLKLDPALAAALGEWAARQPDLPEASAERVAYAKGAGKELSGLAGFAPLWAEVRSSFHDFGACVISGLPTAQARQTALALAANIMDVTDQYGQLPSDIMITTDDKAQYQAGFQRLFELHVDFSFDPHPPNTTFIYCVQPDPGYPDYGLSYLLSASQIIEGLTRYGRTDLLDFALNVPVTFTHDKKPEQNTTAPLLERRTDLPGGYSVRYRRRFMPSAFVQTYGLLLDQYEEFSQALAMEFVLDRGDLLILDNTRFVHGRGPCTLAYDETGQMISRQVVSVWGNKL